ncbi:putative oxidoreductase dhs-27 [Aphelenchoides besseyi]|nr:putative oxidoreductase dhs-27 [Aphelenchoides besseyi]
MNCALKKLVEASVSLEDRFEDSRYNVEWMLGTLLDCHREFRESITRSNVAKVDVMKIGEQTGFCSHLLKVTITFVDSTENPISFVLKIPNADRICERMVDSWNMQEELRENVSRQILNSHNVEIDAYSILSKIPVSVFPLPHIFFTERYSRNTDGIIIMEDLSDRASSLPFGVSTYVQCSIPKNKWNGRFAKNIHVSTESEGGEYKADSLRRAMSLRNCELEKQLKRILSIDWYRFSKFAIIDKAKEYNANTLSHGDTWCNNLMFRLNSNGSIGNTIEGIVDWQTMFEGSALFDLARFLVLSADPDIRRAIQHKMVDFFYAELTKNFAVHDLTPPFTLDQAQELFLLAAFHQTPMLVLYYALIYEPMERSELEADRLRAESAWLKVRLAFEDAEPVWEKYRILEIFGKRTN